MEKATFFTTLAALFNLITRFIKGSEHFINSYARIGELTEKKTETWVVQQEHELASARKLADLPE